MLFTFKQLSISGFAPENIVIVAGKNELKSCFCGTISHFNISLILCVVACGRYQAVSLW